MAYPYKMFKKGDDFDKSLKNLKKEFLIQHKENRYGNYKENHQRIES